MNIKRNKRYGFGDFLLDIFLIIITGGLWLFWKIFKWMANN